MSTATIIIGALQHCDLVLATALVATRGMWCSLAPRISAACALDSKLLALVAQSPTVWCTAELHVASLTAGELGRVPETFPQLQRITVSDWYSPDGALASMLSSVCSPAAGAGAATTAIRAIVLTGDVIVSDAVVARDCLGRRGASRRSTCGAAST